jgi:hypothetical protein
MPGNRRTFPFGLGIPERQEDQLHRRIVAREVPAFLYRLARLTVRALDGIGGVDDPPDRLRPDFRVLVNDRLPNSHKLADCEKAPVHEEYRIVYAVISRQKGNNVSAK